MRHDEVERFEVGQFTVSIVYDTAPSDSPRDWDNVGTMVCWHSRYNLGDEQPDYSQREFAIRLMQLREYEKHRKWVPDELPDAHVERYINKHFYVLELYLHDHGGMELFADTSDEFTVPQGGEVGWIYMSKEDAEREGLPDPLATLRSEVEVYSQYLNGEVYGYEVREKCDKCGHDGDVVDSCWGFYGLEFCKEQAREAAEHAATT